MRRVVYGGTFNPPHLGHIQAVCSVSNALKPDKLLIMPTFLAPHKEMSGDTPPPEERMELCRLAFGELPGVEVSDLEMRRTGKSYTSDTILELKAMYPGDELMFVMGTDMILSLETWHAPEVILENAALAVLLRGDPADGQVPTHIEHLKQRYGGTITLVEAPVYPASSTELREALKRAGGRELLSDEVYARIIKRRDYGAKAALSWRKELRCWWRVSSPSGTIRPLSSCATGSDPLLTRGWRSPPNRTARRFRESSISRSPRRTIPGCGRSAWCSVCFPATNR